MALVGLFLPFLTHTHTPQHMHTHRHTHRHCTRRRMGAGLVLAALLLVLLDCREWGGGGVGNVGQILLCLV